MKAIRRCRLACLLFVVGLVLPIAGGAQSANAVYDVSTLKPRPYGNGGTGWFGLADGVRATNVSARELIASAWELRPDQVTGGPDWVREQHWDFTAKSTEMTSGDLRDVSAEEKKRMLQAVLTERLGLKVHQETRMAAIYSLVPAKGGVKLKPLVLTADQKAAPDRVRADITLNGSDAGMQITARSTSMPMILRNLANSTGKTILDKTGLAPDAVYNFSLRFATDGAPPSNAADAPPPLPTALEEQLGLHLEAGRGPEPVLVINAVQKPSEN